MSEDATVTSAQVRDELLNLLSRDLVGPWDGTDETIDGTPRARYLVGTLAPISLLEGEPSTEISAAASDSSLATVRADASLAVTALGNSHEVQGVPSNEDESIVEATAAEHDEDRGPESKIIAPSSMGMRFQVSPETPSLTFAARWGRYESRREDDEAGRPRTYYDRTQHEEFAHIDLTTLAPGEAKLIELAAEHVAISIEIFEYDGRRVVEAALLNTKVTGHELPPRLWLFQAELEVASPDGAAVFLPTRDALDTDRGSRDHEVRRLDLLYRDRLEFAVGRTASVTWTVSEEDNRRAQSVRTTWLPTAEVPQTLAPDVPGAVLSMRQLLDADGKEVRGFLEPLVEGSVFVKVGEAGGCQAASRSSSAGG